MSSRSFRPHRGFTLVELLIVITIIGMLMGLTSVAIYNAMNSARDAKVAVEIEQMAQAMNGYKEKHLAYPPCMGGSPISTTRQTLFQRHMAQAFPNFSVTYASAKNAISTTYSYSYVVPGSSTIQVLNLDTLDAAEALVFWLGGLPTPVTSTGTPIAATKLFGFHRDPSNPLKREAADVTLTANAIQFRTSAISFQFDQTRLVDNDQDGWLEYVPKRPEGGQLTPPFVYFDSNSYGFLTTASTASSFLRYPNPLDPTSSSEQAAYLMNYWGTVAPLAMRLGSTSAGATTIQWAQPNGVQIIAAGRDGFYAGAGSVSLTGVRIPTFPNTDNKNGEVYAIGGGQFTAPNFTSPYMTEREFDNLTNMSGKTLDATRQEVQK